MKPDSYINCLEPGADNPQKHKLPPTPEPPEGFVDNTVYRYRIDEDGNKVLIGTMDAFPEGWDDPQKLREKGFQKKKEDDEMARYYWKVLWPQAQELLAQGLSTAKVAEKLGVDAPALRCKIDRERRKDQKQTPAPESAEAVNQEPEREEAEPAGNSVAQEEPLAQREQGFGPEDEEPIPYQVVGKYEALGKAIGALVDEKNLQYGDSFNRGGCILEILYPDGVKPEQYRDMLGVIRVIDKLFRVANGKQGNENPWQDIAGYGLLGTGE